MTTRTSPRKVDEAVARRFLQLRHLAVVGASPHKGNFGAEIVRALRQQGTTVSVVHPSGEAVDDAPGYTELAALPGDVDGVVVLVPADAAAGVVRQCAARGIRRVWLFRGVGAGAVSDDALAACDELGLEVVPGACPLMFLVPTGWPHRIHRAARRARHALVPGAAGT